MSPLSSGHLTLMEAGIKSWHLLVRVLSLLCRKAVEKLPKFNTCDKDNHSSQRDQDET